MIDYDRDYHDPPAPLARVVLGRPGSDAKIEGLRMLLDSGAATTLLPGEPCRELGIEPIADRFIEVEGYDGNRKQLRVVDAMIVLQGYKFKGEYLVDEGREIGVIGRNILNKIIVELNGPKLIWAVRIA